MNFVFPNKSGHKELNFLWPDVLGFSFFAFSIQSYNYWYSFWGPKNAKITKNDQIIEKLSQGDQSS